MLSHLNLLSYLSVVSSNLSTENALNVECDAAKYGDNLNISDCKDLCQAVYLFLPAPSRSRGSIVKPITRKRTLPCPALQIDTWVASNSTFCFPFSFFHFFIFAFFIFQKRLAFTKVFSIPPTYRWRTVFHISGFNRVSYHG